MAKFTHLKFAFIWMLIPEELVLIGGVPPQENGHKTYYSWRKPRVY